MWPFNLLSKKLPKIYRENFTIKNPEFKGKYTKLKLFWIEQIDSKKDNSIITLLKIQETKFMTLPESFRVFNTDSEVKSSKLKKPVKEILIIKLQEFNDWRKSR